MRALARHRVIGRRRVVIAPDRGSRQGVTSEGEASPIRFDSSRPRPPSVIPVEPDESDANYCMAEITSDDSEYGTWLTSAMDGEDPRKKAEE